jgi:DNA (cytosine-5)-methyltransferase 1
MNKPVSYGSVCSGIEAASVAWHWLGWQPAWFAEIEKFPSAVLAYRWPDVSNLGDMTQIAAAIRAGKIEAPDVLVGGTPCQAFSVAGLRNGLADERGQLTLAFVELVNAIDEKRREQGKPPVTVVWENVPGVFSSKDNAFGCFLAGLAGESCALESPGKRWSNAGYVLGPERAIAWRVLDAQFFGVAQRRRRVFVVATARGDIDPAKILFESEGLRRDYPPRRETTEIVAAFTARGAGTGGADDSQEQAGHLQTVVGAIAAHSFTGGAGGRPEGAAAGHYIPVGTFRLRAFGEYVKDGTGSTCKARYHKDATDLAVMSVHGTQDNDIQKNMAVRRLTPVECERLQGFPDNHTLIPTQKRKQLTAEEYAYLRHHRSELTAEQAYRLAADGPRYKAIGNSMAVPVMRWIGSRIQEALRA